MRKSGIFKSNFFGVHLDPIQFVNGTKKLWNITKLTSDFNASTFLSNAKAVAVSGVPSFVSELAHKWKADAYSSRSSSKSEI